MDTERSTTGGLVALIGQPLTGSLSPAIHNAAFAHVGSSTRYVARPTPPADLSAVVDELRTGKLIGANVTVPHKVAVRPMLDDESGVVTATGAVNTIVRTAGGLRGENTDVAGFRHALHAAGIAPDDGRDAVVIGAGGAARAVVFALLEDGWRVTVLNRSSGTLGVLAGAMHRAFRDSRLSTAPLDAARLVRYADDATLLVNATPIGSVAERTGGVDRVRAGGAGRDRGGGVDNFRGSDAGGSPWPEDVPVPKHLTVIDIVAWPPRTRFVRQARADGARAHGGLEMLLGQAAAAWTLWTGAPAPIEVMRAAALEMALEVEPPLDRASV